MILRTMGLGGITKGVTMNPLYIIRRVHDGYDTILAWLETSSLIALLRKGRARYLARPGIKPLDIHCQVHIGYLYRGSPRMPRPSPKDTKMLVAN